MAHSGDRCAVSQSQAAVVLFHPAVGAWTGVPSRHTPTVRIVCKMGFLRIDEAVMLSTDRCRQILSVHDATPDCEVEAIRDHLYALAEIVFDTMDRNPKACEVFGNSIAERTYNDEKSKCRNLRQKRN